MPRQSKKTLAALAGLHADITEAESVIVKAALKQLPIPMLDTATVTLKVDAPFDFITGRRRRTLSTALRLEYMEATQRLTQASKTKTDGMTPEQQQAFVEAQMRNMFAVYDLIARILNTMLVEWNLVEYARSDNEPFSAPGSISRADVTQMSDDMRNAIVAAIMAAPQAEAEQKKG